MTPAHTRERGIFLVLGLVVSGTVFLGHDNLEDGDAVALLR